MKYKNGDVLKVKKEHEELFPNKVILFDTAYKDIAYTYYKPIVFEFRFLEYFDVKIEGEEKNSQRIYFGKLPISESFTYADISYDDSGFYFVYYNDKLGVTKNERFRYLHEFITIIKTYGKNRVTINLAKILSN